MGRNRPETGILTTKNTQMTRYLMPPYVVSDDEIAHLGNALNGALSAALVK